MIMNDHICMTRFVFHVLASNNGESFDLMFDFAEYMYVLVELFCLWFYCI